MVQYLDDSFLDSYEVFGIPELILFGKCDLCPERADLICDDCQATEICNHCLETTFNKSETYQTFMEDAHQYTCIYCFVELQAGELASVGGRTPPRKIEEDQVVENIGR
jgi:hypothetical protein